VIGKQIPDVTLKTRVRDESVDGPNPFRWEDLEVRDEFAGKRVVVFSLPGAFTPTCSNEQCPSFERLYDTFRKAGFDDVYCVSVNDAFVIYQWGKNLGLEKVKLLPDGNGDFTRRMGMLIDKRHLGFGSRTGSRSPGSTTSALTMTPMAKPPPSTFWRWPEGRTRWQALPEMRPVRAARCPSPSPAHGH
jgi:thioredoxin-dependent peroxiredoxin